MSLTITLTPQVEHRIRDLIESGHYPDADAVLNDALGLLEETRLAALRSKLQSGIDQLDRGEGIPFTPEWSADRVRVIRERAAAGETPHIDVCP